MIQPDTNLVAAAQMSVAITGFAGVVAAFRRESLHKWGWLERFWFQLQLVNSVLPLLFSLFGLFLLTIMPPPSAVWRWCSGLAALALIPYAAAILKKLSSFAPKNLKPGSKLISYVLFGLLLLVCMLQIWNVVIPGAFWPFYVAILALILGAVCQFVRLVLIMHKADAQHANDKTTVEGD